MDNFLIIDFIGIHIQSLSIWLGDLRHGAAFMGLSCRLLDSSDVKYTASQQNLLEG